MVLDEIQPSAMCFFPMNAVFKNSFLLIFTALVFFKTVLFLSLCFHVNGISLSTSTQ